MCTLSTSKGYSRLSAEEGTLSSRICESEDSEEEDSYSDDEDSDSDEDDGKIYILSNIQYWIMMSK